jgi:Holliday junction DNA helicase RuvA
MYDHIEGELVFKSPAQAVIAAGGVGYRFSIPISTFAALPEHGRAKLLTYLHVREDVLKLFGFASEKERRLFIRLIGVSGIGPGTAMAILNGLSVDEFRRAVAAEEVSTLCRVKGIGRKTAERVIVELRRDMERELLEEPPTRGTAASLTADAVAAMLALGYTRSVSEAAVLRALEKLGRAADLEQVVRQALQQV